MTVETLEVAMGLAKAHSLAISRIPGLRVATVKVHADGALFAEDIYCCVGHCHKCDGYWRTFRTEPSLILEVIEVGYTKPAAPPEAVKLSD